MMYTNGKMRVLVDDYLQNKEKIDKQCEMFGMEAYPVDSNGRFVPINKNDKGNLKKSQDDLNERMDIGS